MARTRYLIVQLIEPQAGIFDLLGNLPQPLPSPATGISLQREPSFVAYQRGYVATIDAGIVEGGRDILAE